MCSQKPCVRDPHFLVSCRAVWGDVRAGLCIEKGVGRPRSTMAIIRWPQWGYEGSRGLAVGVLRK